MKKGEGFYRNSFPDEVRALYTWEHNCWDCGRSDMGVEADHIRGRISNSPYNLYLICRRCHMAKIHADDLKRLATAQEFLKRIEYIPNDNDHLFLEKYGNTKSNNP